MAVASIVPASASPQDRKPNPSAKKAGITAEDGGYAGWALQGRVKHRQATQQSKKVPGVPGIDVSAYQHNVDWNSWWKQGKRFAYVKATEGTFYQNDYFNQQYTGSYDVGMTRGSYHFARPDRTSGSAEADYFIAHGGGWSADGKTLPGMLDIEDNYTGGARCYGKSPSQLVSWVRSFVNRYRAKTTRDPVIYTNASFWRDCLGNTTEFANTPLSIASWTANPPSSFPGGWSDYTFWQYSGTGTDLDAYNGSRAKLKAFATGYETGTHMSAPSVVSWAKGRLDVFARNTRTNHIMHKWYKNGSWHGWSDLGGNARGAPAAASWAKGRIDIVATGRSGSVFHKAYRRHSWTGWVKRPGVTTHSGPAATSWGKGRLDIFARDQRTNHIRHMAYRNGSWLKRWSDLGGNVKGAPAAASWATGRVDIVATGQSRSVFHKAYRRHSWTGWVKHGGVRTRSGPAVTSWGKGRLDIFARDQRNNHIRHMAYRRGSWLKNWSNLNGNARGAPAAASWAKGRVDVFATGRSTHVFHKYYRSGWSSWNDIG